MASEPRCDLPGTITYRASGTATWGMGGALFGLGAVTAWLFLELVRLRHVIPDGARGVVACATVLFPVLTLVLWATVVTIWRDAARGLPRLTVGPAGVCLDTRRGRT